MAGKNSKDRDNLQHKLEIKTSKIQQENMKGKTNLQNKLDKKDDKMMVNRVENGRRYFFLSIPLLSMVHS